MTTSVSTHLHCALSCVAKRLWHDLVRFISIKILLFFYHRIIRNDELVL